MRHFGMDWMIENWLNKTYRLSHILFLEFRRAVSGKIFGAEIDVTDKCNLRCKHCYHFHGKKDFRAEELSIEEWEARFNELHKSGIRSVLLVGGEPALRTDVLMLADRTFPFVYVITNGTVNIPREFDHRLFVSIDGLKDTNDSIRGPGSFSRALNNYRRDKRVIINMTITKRNYHELVQIVQLARDNGFTGVVCNIFTPTIGENSVFFISEQDRKAIISELRRVKSLYPRHFLLNEKMIKWYEKPDHRDSCYWGDDVLHFDVSWNKRRCFTKADCSNCGCVAGSLQNPLKMVMRHPKEMLHII
jgi:Fe-coproporphyrin III synthase